CLLNHECSTVNSLGSQVDDANFALKLNLPRTLFSSKQFTCCQSIAVVEASSRGSIKIDTPSSKYIAPVYSLGSITNPKWPQILPLVSLASEMPGKHPNVCLTKALTLGAALICHVDDVKAGFPSIKNLVTFGDSFTDEFGIGNAYNANVTHEYDGVTYIKSPESGDYVPLITEETMMSIWIGTNDVGYDSLLMNTQEGVSVVNTTACVLDWMKVLYDQGMRNFLLQNMITLYQAPFYSPDGILMAEMVQASNELYALRTKYIAPSQFLGARIGLFDSFGLFNDIYNNPWKYLVGPDYNVKDAINACRYPEGSSELICVNQPPEVHDSFLWWDEIHPSEQTNRVIARHLLAALKGTSPFVSWYGSVYAS
ncbi:GDSL-like Lipase/Acylhydrolase, partial [Rhizoctonia solani]